MTTKRLSIILILFLLLSGLTLTAQNKNEKIINRILDQWHIDVAEAHFDNYFNAFAKNGVFIGTDAEEIWTVDEFKSFSKPFFEKKKTWNFKPLKRNIYFSDDLNTAWFDELLNTWMGVCRGSGVMIKDKNNRWKIAQYVLSVTIPNDDMKTVINAKKAGDSIVLRKFNIK